MYQMMDEGFVGLIFSCFNDDTSTAVSHLYFSIEYLRVFFLRFERENLQGYCTGEGANCSCLLSVSKISTGLV